MQISSVKEIKDLSNKKVLLRIDANVPIKEGKVIDAYRLEQSLETINFLLSGGAKVLIVAHIDKKEGGSLFPVFEWFKSKLVDKKISFSTDLFNSDSNSDLVIFENIRNYPGEELNDEEFAKKLSSIADIYVNEAFSVCHRRHASIVGVTKYIPSYAGVRLIEEVEKLSEVFSPKKPFLFILGGAKFSTKIPLIEKYINHADYLFIGGAIVHCFFRDKGYEIGESVIDEYSAKEYLDAKNIMIPTDVLAVGPQGDRICLSNEVQKDEMIMDAGPETMKELIKKASECMTVVWNGPLGFYEKGYSKATDELAKALADLSEKNSEFKVIIGGGDTLVSIEKLGLRDKYYFVSTGGGAMLDFLANETLVGVEALKLA